MEATTLTNAELAAELAYLGISFVESSSEDKLPLSPDRDLLLAALASSNEARLRMALIPLFLARPEFARSVLDVVGTLSKEAQITLMCYYTAAMILQRKYSQSLTDLGLVQHELPDLFGRTIGLPQTGETDDLLKALGERQAVLSGRPINWFGTYEHVALRFVQRLQQERVWATS